MYNIIRRPLPCRRSSGCEKVVSGFLVSLLLRNARGCGREILARARVTSEVSALAPPWPLPGLPPGTQIPTLPRPEHSWTTFSSNLAFHALSDAFCGDCWPIFRA